MVAAGEGRRFGALKQFAELGGQSVLERSVAAARSVAASVIAVVPAHAVDDPLLHGGADVAVAGGAERAASVRAGLAAVPEDAAVVVVHDAARPLAPPTLFTAVVAAIEPGVDGAVPAVPVTDTVKRVAAGLVVETLERATLVAVQTPQAFAAEALRAAAAGEGSDCASLVEAAGGRIKVVEGDERLLKVTTPADLRRVEERLAVERTE